jgi:hypothetical protein
VVLIHPEIGDELAALNLSIFDRDAPPPGAAVR